MNKRILLVAAMLAGSMTFAQQKKEKQPPPPPPPPPQIVDVKEIPPPPPPPKPPAKKEVRLPEDHQAFLKRNPTVKALKWTENKVHIRLKSGKEEEYDLNNEEDMQKVKNKYGELPAPPPKVIKVKAGS